MVFDIDDTLYLERDYVRSGFNAVGEHVESQFGTAGVGRRAWELFIEGVVPGPLGEKLPRSPADAGGAELALDVLT
ncbi:MAG: hypothetical protein AAGK32_10970, partial [Actinomycetota bacterium]